MIFFFPLGVHKPKRNRGNAKSACIYYLALFIHTSFFALKRVSSVEWQTVDSIFCPSWTVVLR